ncbi:nfeD-like C-terminal, partner-binding family protein [Collimonas arenae]|uniref:NfeD-like C-terminal, partner-binding family protein n=1 Tax=Collimonas arenae TaxID=279058 RepID=A0A127QL96_9BURK|nr:NfeD family protein [Collimonas arenae]AMP10820.1 nfeD-like C-terminal, partner-binding family protein [Collimonas arenae]
MAGWVMWMLAAGVLVVLELFSTTFYLLMVAIGLAAGGIAALAGLDIEWQLLIAAIVAVIATYILRRSRFGRRVRVRAERDPNVNLDIGQSLMVDQWQHEGGTAGVADLYTARVKYRGAMWDVELVPSAVAQSGLYVIHEVRGSRLIVGNAPDKH